MLTNTKQQAGIGLAATILLAASAIVWARPVQILTVEEQYQQADLVVIASAVETRDLLAQQPAAADAWRAVQTDFLVEAIVQGNPPRLGEEGKHIVTVEHFRYQDKSAEVSVVDSPTFVEFNPQLKHRYLLSLKRMEGGHYAPVSGQMDPGLSFFRLEPYALDLERVTPKQ